MGVDPGTVRVLAHRGSPTTSAENTVAAILDSLLVGADGVEVDLRLSADGVLVVSHDPDLRRLTGLALPVASTAWPELRAAAASRGLALARLEWVLAALAGRPVVLELKAPPPMPGASELTAEVLVRQLAALRAADLPLQVTVSSFAPLLVRAVRAQAAGAVRTALLARPGVRPGGVLRQALVDGHDEIHPHVLSLLAEPGCVRAAHACGVAVVPWTVNRSRALRRCSALGVDAVITDVPDAARSAVLSGAAAQPNRPVM